MKIRAPQHDPDATARAREALLAAHRRGEPRELEAHWDASGPGATIEDLAALVKLDMQCRAERGERPTVQDYAGRFPALAGHKDRMVSLIYEEYCLAEERGEEARASEFCRRYAPWADSLAWQLDCHAHFSRFVPAPGPAPRFPEVNERFGGFRLRQVLGQGGAARVYLATEEDVGDRKVALKVSADRGDEPSIQGRLDHAHIVPVLSVVRRPEGDLRGLCMPYREGMTLDRVLDRVRPGGTGRRRAADLPGALVEPGEAAVDWPGFPARGSYAQGVAWVIARVAEALAHAHSRQIHHRDVKPANVLLTRLNGPQLLDFNLAHDRDAVEEARAALRGGTLPYMAPEQLAALGDPARWPQVGARADLFSLGLLAAELLTGRRPRSPDPALPLPAMLGELLALRAQGQSPLATPGRAIPHALRAILERCMRADPSQRYPDAEALAEDLRRFVGGRPLRTARNPSPREVAGNWARRNRPLLALGLAGALLAAATPSLKTWAEGPNAAAVHAGVGHDFIAKINLPPKDRTEQKRAEKALLDAAHLDAAEREYRHALRLDPKLYTVHEGLGFVAQRRGRPDDMLRHYADALALATAPGIEIKDVDLANLYIGHTNARCQQALLLLRGGRDGEDKAWRLYQDNVEELRAVRSIVDPVYRRQLEAMVLHSEFGQADCLLVRDRPGAVAAYRRLAVAVAVAMKASPKNDVLSEMAQNLAQRLKDYALATREQL